MSEHLDWYDRLSRAEREVLEAYAEHHGYKAVARALGKSESVVDQQLTSARRKMDVVNTAQAMSMLAERKARLAAEAARELLSEGSEVRNGGSVMEQAELSQAIRSGPVPKSAELHPPGGAMRLDSPLYVKRHADDVLSSALSRHDGMIRVRGPRQTGKTSLLARGLAQARKAGARVIVTDFQRLDAAETSSVDAFYSALANRIAAQLKTGSPEEYWKAPGPAVAKFDDFFESEVLSVSDSPVVWGIDEADGIFGRDYREQVFGNVRGWYNARALDANPLWNRLSLILTYSSEAHLLIRDLNHSPFNIGTAVELEDFNSEQVSGLNARYGEPLRDEGETQRLGSLLGGQPYLICHCLHEMVTRKMDFDAVEESAQNYNGLFFEHLTHLKLVISQDPELLSTTRALLGRDAVTTDDGLRRLNAAGIVTGGSKSKARFRCRLYEEYLSSSLE